MFKTLEKKYGIRVVSEGAHWNPLTGRFTTTYTIYTADECCWEKGLSREGVKRECEVWGEELKKIRDANPINKF